MSLTLVWTKNGYSGVFNGNYEGGFQRFNSIDCQSDIAKNCKKIDFEDSRGKLLIGDSEAMSLSDQFKSRFGKSGVVYALSGCSFLPKSIIRETKTPGCVELNEYLMEQIKLHCRIDLYIFNRFIPADVTEHRRYLAFLGLISEKCNRVTVIGTPPQIKGNYSAYSSLLFTVSLDSPRKFNKSDFLMEYMRFNSDLQIAIKYNKKIIYIDTVSLLIKGFPTALKNKNGDYLFTDSTHLSKFGAEIIVKNLS